MRIGLLAMSGVRACDEELMRMGLTLPGFVERSETIASLPSLGLLTLAGLTPDDCDVVYFEVDEPADHVARDDLDLVAISTFTAQAEDAYQVADRYREAGVRVVIGGLHATSIPGEALAHADAVVVGEGEVVWPRVLDDARQGQLAGVYRAGPHEFALEDAPMPRFDLLNIDRYNRLTVQTTRGCPWRCSFCASSILLTNRYKHKPVERVLAEIDAIRAIWPRAFIEFADDNSFVNRRYWLELLPQLAARRVRWFTETDITVGEDDELLSLMAKAGCAEVLIGLESPVSDGLAGLEQRRDWKLKKQPMYKHAVRNIQAHGIRVNACFIVGLDGHGPDIFDRVYDFAREIEAYDVQVTLPTPFPGTAMYEQLRESGRLFEERPWRRCTLFDLTFEPTPMSADELVSGFRGLVGRMYSDEATAWRRQTFREKYARRPAMRRR